MTKSIARKMTAVAAVLVAAESWGYTIDSGAIDVGGQDQLVQWTNSLANSNPTTETNWVNSILNPDMPFTLKTETVSYQAVDGGGMWAFALQSDPGFYVIKNATFWALFDNKDSLSWAVFNLEGLPNGINLGGSGELTISHVSEFSGSTSVSEPSTVSLIAVGLLGLVAARHYAHLKV